jgi:hypothetical protein
MTSCALIDDDLRNINVARENSVHAHHFKNDELLCVHALFLEPPAAASARTAGGGGGGGACLLHRRHRRSSSWRRHRLPALVPM